MPTLEHLHLIRLEPLPERRKRPGFGSASERDYRTHGEKIRSETAVALDHHRALRRTGVDPALILKVRLDGNVTEEEWERAGLVVLADDPDKTLVLFANDDELTAFRERVEKYSGGPPTNQISPPHAALVSSIEEISVLSAKDRLGLAARTEGYSGADDFDPRSNYTLDIALWDLGDRDRINLVVGRIERLVSEAGGEIPDRYLGRSLLLLRVSGSGALFQQLLEVPEISEIDLLPAVDVEAEELLDVGIQNVAIGDVEDDAIIIGVIDSGVTDHPLLRNVTVGVRGFPEELGTADAFGHGTKVAGISVYGDLRAALAEEELIPRARLVSAKVVNNSGQFPSHRLVINQMRDCISVLNEEYGVRIFNISLADRRRVFDGAKPSAWAAVLDELARELDIIIVVSAGNRRPPCPTEEPERAVTDYPRYLFDADNRIFEPASSALAITVGALAHGNGLPGGVFEAVNVRAIAGRDQPAPFSRIGPGVQGAIKPDFSDYGGTYIFDGAIPTTKGGDKFPSAGVLAPHHKFLDRLLTAGSGTSYAAPRVAFKAAEVLRAFPDASANLLRALLANSATQPPASIDLLRPFGDDAPYRAIGYGIIDARKAIESDQNRAILYAEQDIGLDHFAVFEVPIPREFQTEAGRRWIRISLAFDPPVRHTRLDYLGVTMSFRLVRGWSPEQVFEHFRKRNVREEGRHPDLPPAFDCDLVPRKNQRDNGSLQSASFTMRRDVSRWGDPYYLVVRAEGGWATAMLNTQSFAVVVEIGHEAEVPLYARVRERVVERIRART